MAIVKRENCKQTVQTHGKYGVVLCIYCVGTVHQLIREKAVVALTQLPVRQSEAFAVAKDTFLASLQGLQHLFSSNAVSSLEFWRGRGGPLQVRAAHGGQLPVSPDSRPEDSALPGCAA